MTKGNEGESCSEAIRASLQSKEIVTFSELYKRVKQKGTWKDNSVSARYDGAHRKSPSCKTSLENYGAVSVLAW